MAVRFYSNTAPPTTLTAGINAITTTITIASAAGLPVFQPYTLAIDPDTPTMELVEVTAAAGTTLTVTRAIDGTSASLHSAGAVVMHVTSARDQAESRAHENASTNVHGLSGGAAVVGTTQTQTLTNKTLTSPAINTPAITGGTATNQTISTNQTILANKKIEVTDNVADGGNLIEVNLPTGGEQYGFAFLHAADSMPIARIQYDGQIDTKGGMRIDGGTGLAGGTIIREPPDLATYALVVQKSLAAGSGSLLEVSSTEVRTYVPFEPFKQTTTGASVFSVATGWSLNTAVAVRAGGMVTLNIIVQRTGANIVASATGDLPDTLLGTLNASFRPNSSFNSSDFSFIAQNSIGDGAANLVNSTGNLTLRSWSAGATISTGNNVCLTATYVL